MTTLAGFKATSGVSSLSSELAGLIFTINSWKVNPTLLKVTILNDIKPVKNVSGDLTSYLRGDPSCSGCGSERKRVLRGTIGDIVKRSTCIETDLEKQIESVLMTLTPLIIPQTT